MGALLLTLALHAAPSFTATDRFGASVKFDAQKGPYAGKPLVLYFWNPACGPCLRHFPGLVALARRHPEVSVVTVIGALDDDDPKQLPRALADIGVDVADLPLLILFDKPKAKRTEDGPWERYRVRSFGTMALVTAEGDMLPFTYLGDQQRCALSGIIDWDVHGELVIGRVKEGKSIQVKSDSPGEYDAPCQP